MANKIRIVKQGDSYLVCEPNFQPLCEKGGEDNGFLTYAVVSYIHKTGGYMIITNYPWKNYVRMGEIAEELRNTDIIITDSSWNLEQIALEKAMEVGRKIAKEKNMKLELLVYDDKGKV